MKMRDYQAAACDGIFKVFEEKRSALAVLPTGLGKTVLFAEVIRRMAERGKRALVLAHREELITQAADKVKRVTGLDAQIEMGEYKVQTMFGVLPPVIVSTVQTQCAGGDGGGRMTKFLPDDIGLVVVDEAHHSTSRSYRRCINYYFQNPECKLLGVTATPDRADEVALGSVFDEVAYDYQILDAINNGWLVPIEQQMVTVGTLDFSGVKTTAGDLNQGELADIMEDERNLQAIAVPTVQICGTKRAIIFAASVKQAERLAEIINRYAPDKASWISGKTDKDDRRRILADFKAGRLQFVVNVGVLTEGFDDSGVEVVVMARPTKSRALYAQMAGRATRPADEVAGLLGDCPTAAERVSMIRNSRKPSCLIVDFAGNSSKHKLCSTADILGGNIEDDVITETTRRVREFGKPVDMAAELEKTKKLVEERKRKEAATRAGLQARAQFLTTKIDPFNAWDLAPVKERGWDKGKKFTPKQSQILLERIGVDPNKIPYGQGKQLLDEYFRRIDVGYATIKQANLLKRNGFHCPLKMGQASRMITRARANQGW